MCLEILDRTCHTNNLTLLTLFGISHKTTYSAENKQNIFFQQIFFVIVQVVKENIF